MSSPVRLLSAREQAGLMALGELAPVDAVEAHLPRIEERNGRTNSYVTLQRETARREAAEMEKRLLHGEKPGFCRHMPFTSVGPLTRTVGAAALMLEAMKGPDPRDPLCLPADLTDLTEATEVDISDLRIAYSPNLDVYPVEPEVARVCREAVLAFAAAGAKVEQVSPGLERSQAELCAVWRRRHAVLDLAGVLAFERAGVDLLGSHRRDLPLQFVESVERAAAMTAADMARDDWVRTEVLDAFEDVLENHNLLVCPTLSCAPVENGEKGVTLGPSLVCGEKVDPLIGWCLTYLVDFTGHPAASLPAGLSADGLPVGLQIIGRKSGDHAVLAASAAYERVRP